MELRIFRKFAFRHLHHHGFGVSFTSMMDLTLTGFYHIFRQPSQQKTLDRGKEEILLTIHCLWGVYSMMLTGSVARDLVK